MIKKAIIAYKGFDKNLKCRGYQFEVGKTYEHDGKVIACQSGFHACLNPFDVWGYYNVQSSRFARVKLEGKTNKDGDDTKIAAAKMTIEAELKLPEFIKAAVEYIIDLTKGKNDKKKIGSSGYSAHIGSSGYSARIGSSGDYAQIGSSGYSARIGSSGYSAHIGSSGDYAQIGSSGDYARIGSSGDYAHIGSSGDYAQIEIEGENSIASTVGVGGKIKAPDGTPIAIAEYRNGKPIGFATGVVGKKGIKPDTLYCAKDGKLVEVQS